MTSKWKQVLAVLVSVALLFTLPQVALAADPEWDGQSSLTGGRYTISGPVTVTGDITISGGTVVTLTTDASLTVSGTLRVESSTITGGAVRVESGSIYVNGGSLDALETKQTSAVDIYGYSRIGTITPVGYTANISISGGTAVEEIITDDTYANRVNGLYVTGSDTLVKQLTFHYGTVHVQNGGTVSELLLDAPAATSTAKKGQVNVLNATVGQLTVQGYGVVQNTEGGRIETAVVETDGTGYRGASNLSNYNDGSIGSVTVIKGTVDNGSAALSTSGTIGSLTVNGGTVTNNAGSSVETAVITDGTLSNGVSGNGFIGELDVQGGQVNNESGGTITTLNLSAGTVENDGTVTTCNKMAGNTGTLSGTSAGTTNENMVRIRIDDKMVNGTVEVKNGTASVADNTMVPSGTTLTVTAVPDDGYNLELGSLQQNGTAITDGSFVVGDAEVLITASFVSRDTLQEWDGSSNPPAGIYEVLQPLVISSSVTIPAGVEIRLGTGGSLTVGDGGILNNYGTLKLPATVTGSGSLYNQTGGTLTSVTVQANATLYNYGEIASLEMKSGSTGYHSQGTVASAAITGGTFYGTAAVTDAQVSGGSFYLHEETGVAGTVTQTGGLVDCWNEARVGTLTMTGGTAWSTAYATFENVSVTNATLNCALYRGTGDPGRLGTVTANSGSIIISEGCEVEKLIIPQGKTPLITNNGTIQEVEGRLVTGYEVRNAKLSTSDAMPTAITISWSPLQATLLGGTSEAVSAENVTYYVIRWVESMAEMTPEEILQHPPAPGEFLSETSYRVVLPEGTEYQTHYFRVVAVLKSDSSQKWAYDQLVAEMGVQEPEPVYITPSATQAPAGSNVQFAAYGKNNSEIPGGVDWKVEGNNSAATYINAAGLLRIGADETAATLKVRAVPKEDNRVSAEATVTIIAVEPAQYTVTVNGGEGSGSYAEGSQAVLLARPEAGKKFAYWTAEGVALTDAQKYENPLTITVASEMTLTAHFADLPSSTYSDPGYDFWMEIRDAIMNAKPGDTIRVEAGSRDMMPYAVMDALLEAEDVTLYITWDGGEDLAIASGAAPQETWRAYYPLSDLAALGYTAPAGTEPDADGSEEEGGVPPTSIPQTGVAADPWVLALGALMAAGLTAGAGLRLRRRRVNR